MAGFRPRLKGSRGTGYRGRGVGEGLRSRKPPNGVLGEAPEIEVVAVALYARDLREAAIRILEVVDHVPVAVEPEDERITLRRWLQA